MQMLRRNLFQNELLQVGHVRARPPSSGRSEIERQSANVLVLPLTGVFAKHEGLRRHVVATPNHAVLIPIDHPYRLSFPGDVGDECLTLRFSPDALARLAPHAMSREGFDTSVLAAHVLLPPELMLARSFMWRRLARGAFLFGP